MELQQHDLLSGVPFSEVAPVVRLAHCLPPMEVRFVFEYPVDKNATRAAVRAGYSAKTAAQQGSRLLKNVKVKAAIAEIVDQIHRKCEIAAERIRYEWSCIGFFDPAWIKSADGSLKPWGEWPERARRAVSSVDVVERVVYVENARGGKEARHVFDHVVKMHSKLDALKMMAQEKHMLSTDDAPAAAGRFIFVTEGERANGPKS